MWAKALLPNQGQWYRPIVYSQQGQVSFGLNRSRIRTGGLRSLSVRTVCDTCNNGWMSRIEEYAKPILKDMVQGKNVHLGWQNKKVLQDWVFLKAAVFDGTRSFNKVIHKRDAIFFRSTRAVPQNFSLWICNCGVEPYNLYLNKYAASHPKIPFSGLGYNVMTFSMGFGNLFILALIDYIPTGYRRIWNLVPPIHRIKLDGEVIEWPTRQVDAGGPYFLTHEAARMYDGMTNAQIDEMMEFLNESPRIRV
jgi:hypothetical protein